MIGASHKNKMALITLSSVFTVGVLAIFISFSYNATASVSTSFVGWRGHSNESTLWIYPTKGGN